ncbi:SET and MYND domain-containing protein 3 [Boothiomyces sp. JEL0866]|nr:SET and MYND domain-containing protein 3 [Boothiomyces sp. JEL0866]
MSKKALFDSLVSHIDKIPGDEISELRSKAERSRIQSHSINAQIEIMSKFRRNNFTIYDYNLFEVGNGTFCQGSLLNHSCVPNATLIFNKREMVVVALRDIGANEEIFISYIDSIYSYEDRSSLLGKYHFNCICEKCNQKLYQIANTALDINQHYVEGLEIVTKHTDLKTLESSIGYYTDLNLYKSVSLDLSQLLEQGGYDACSMLIVQKYAGMLKKIQLV